MTEAQEKRWYRVRFYLHDPENWRELYFHTTSPEAARDEMLGSSIMAKILADMVTDLTIHIVEIVEEEDK